MNDRENLQSTGRIETQNRSIDIITEAEASDLSRKQNPKKNLNRCDEDKNDGPREEECRWHAFNTSCYAYSV